MTDYTIGGSVLAAVKYIIIFIIPFVEPQIAGILGSMAYLVVRHELNMADLSIKSFIIVMFFGWLGAWATVHLFSAYSECEPVMVQISSATAGFLSYDTLLALGKNSKSVIGFLSEILKKIIEKGVEKWFL